ncbi:MAG TPA: MlaD family protein [Bacteroidia bacterium]|jgi:phospholipid/cholesterol/gamma-HCH transport system substrate-binding protein|nr:MlaD family protein [Bacteroidia bacterium]
MSTISISRIKTGTFVIATTIVFIIGLYKIGGKRRMFRSTVQVSVVFKNVNGLTAGNNVRFGGIDVGTVSEVTILADTAVKASLSIEDAAAHFITSNAVASIGTDGLMGNKIVNIIPGKSGGIPVKEGGSLQTLPLIELDNAMRTLYKTNDNLQLITDDARIVMSRFSNKNTLWSLLMDTAVADNVKQAIVNVKLSGRNVIQITHGLDEMVDNVNKGKGSLGALIKDTALSGNLHRTAVDIGIMGKQAATMSTELSGLSDRVSHGQGSVGALLQDSTLVSKVDQAILDFKRGAANFDSSMISLKQNILLRKGIRRQEKKAKRDGKKKTVDPAQQITP